MVCTDVVLVLCYSFHTRKGHKLCAPTGPAWVTNLIKHMDKPTKMCHNTNFKVCCSHLDSTLSSMSALAVQYLQ